MSVLIEHLNAIKVEEMLKIKLAENIKLDFQPAVTDLIHPLIPLHGRHFPFFHGLWLERTFLEWKEINFKYEF